MKRVLLSAFLAFLSLGASAQVITTINVTMEDGDSYVVGGRRNSELVYKKESKIAASITEKVMNSTILKAMEIEKHRTGISSTISENICNSYMYHTYDSGIALGYDPEYESYLSFCHKLVKIQKVREVGYSLITEALVTLCKYYPSDYREYVCNMIEAALNFMVNSLDDFTVSESYAGYYELRNNGQLDSDTGHSISGFIARRILIDGVPAEEIGGYLIDLYNTLKELDLSDSFVTSYLEVINDELVYNIAPGAYNFILNTEDGQFTYHPYEKTGYMFGRIQVKCTKDEETTYYTITNGYINSEGEFLPWNDDDAAVIVFDNKGNILYQE